LITQLNDFVFCPISIYFHMLYGNTNNLLFQTEKQINGTEAHCAIDHQRYSDSKNIICGMDVYNEKYGLTGKIDILNVSEGILIERKNKVKKIYDGYVYQTYAQCVSLREMGYSISKIIIHSCQDNKNYPISLPENDPEMFDKFEQTIEDMHDFKIDEYVQTNVEKCANCIYEPACDRGIADVGKNGF
jgi:CRISPR-associated exonuclease Cas4